MPSAPHTVPVPVLLVGADVTGLLPKSNSRHPVSNNASARVLAKLGMVQEGLLRRSARKGDASREVVMMALLRKEWPPAQKLDRTGASIATQKALS